MVWPRPFTWVPAAGHRHASSDDKPPSREFPPDTNVATLYGRVVVSAAGDLAWLWPTCGDCDEQARALVAMPPRSARYPTAREHS